MSFPLDFPFYTIDSRIVKAVGVDNLRYITMLHENDRHVFSRLYYWEAKRGEFCVKGKRCLAAFPLLGYAILFRSTKVLKYILKQKPDLFQIGAILTDVEDDSGNGTIQKLEEHSGISLTHFLFQKGFYKDALKLFNILMQEEVDIFYKFELRDQRIKNCQMQSYDLFSFEDVFQFLEQGAKAKKEDSEKALYYVKAAEAMYKCQLSYEEALAIAVEGLPIPVIESKEEEIERKSERRSSKGRKGRSNALRSLKSHEGDKREKISSSSKDHRRSTEKYAESDTKRAQNDVEIHEGIESDRSDEKMIHHSETDPTTINHEFHKLDTESKREKSDPKKSWKSAHHRPIRRVESDPKKIVDNEAPKQRMERHKSDGDSVLSKTDLKGALKESLKLKKGHRKPDGSSKRSDISSRKSDPKLTRIDSKDSDGGSKKPRKSGRKSDRDAKMTKQSMKLKVQHKLAKNDYESKSESESKHFEDDYEMIEEDFKNDFLEKNNEENIDERIEEENESDIERDIHENIEENITEKIEETEEKIIETTLDSMKEKIESKTEEDDQRNEGGNITEKIQKSMKESFERENKEVASN